MAISKRAIGAVVLCLLVGLPRPAAAAARPDATSFHAYFPSGDALTTLHAEVLRPKGVSARTRTPVIMTVSPYFGRSPITIQEGMGPDRFNDFLDLTKILSKGYTYVMVDLPGFGGSSGCNDWGGVREQGAVVAAVEWAASQPWSTGRVGLIGKSYDAWTGLMGIARQPKGLAAVVAMEPVYSGYRYLYTNGVRFPNSVVTPLDFTAFDLMPASPDAPLEYQLNAVPQLWCYGINIAMQQQDKADASFWKERDLLAATKGKRTPLFLTQGFLENNTKPDAAYGFFNAMRGPKRAWFGQFAHVRGWEKTGSKYQAGRSGFAAEVARFLDRYVKGVPQVKRDTPVAVQDNLGRYRAETRWPPADDVRLWSPLSPGTYNDDGNNTATGSSGGNGVWTFSQALPHDMWMAGEPIVDVTVQTQFPRTNLVGDVYDVGPGRRATLVSRGAQLVRSSGRSHVTFTLYGQDWLLRKGHRIGVLLSGSNNDWWSHLPTFTSVKVVSASVALPFLTKRRVTFIDGISTPRLTDYVKTATLTVDQATLNGASKTFRLPPPLRSRAR